MAPPTPKQNKEDKKVFKEIFEDHWDEFKRLHPQYDTAQYEEPVQKMLGCGEETGGYSEYICLHCGRDKRRVPFSCKSCFCLSCSKKYVDDFVSQVSKNLHPGVIYRHTVLTLPEQLRLHFYHERHNSDFLSAFMKIGHECLEDVIGTWKNAALKIGCIVVIQTHGRSGQYNPHLHIIMTSGGIDPVSSRWFDLGFFKYELIHKKWQYHLLNFVKDWFGKDIYPLVDELWDKYPDGLVANVSKGQAPHKCKGLAVYLAKYVASPPIAVRRIVSYDGQTVQYWYKDHQTKSKKLETVDVFTFIGRMVQHIMPKWFQRVRYFGLQATKTFKKWADIIQKSVKVVKKVIKGAYQVVKKITYRDRYQGISGQDPLKCRHCGHDMDLWKIWHPKHGVIFDEYENLKSGKYNTLWGGNEDKKEEVEDVSVGVIQLELFPVTA